MNSLSRMLSRIDPRRLNRLLVDAVNRYSPSFAEAPAIRVFAHAAKGAGIPYRFQPVPAHPGDRERANIIMPLGPEPLALLFVGHTDTVSLRQDEGHGARRKGDLLFGLGTADMKGGCAAILEAMTAVKESGLPLAKGFCAALVVGEEEDGDGSEALIGRVAAPLTVIGEPTSLKPCTSHFGYLEGRFSGRGRRRHAALPELSSNVIHAMLEWILKLYDLSGELPDADQLAISPREIHGGESAFVTADSCETMMDFHLPPRMGRDEVEEAIERARASVVACRPDLDLRYERLHWSPGFAHDVDAAVLDPLRRAFEAVEIPWKPDTFRSHSDAVLFHDTGTLTVICGPGDLAMAHRRSERVSLKEVERAARLYAAMIHETCAA